MVVILKKGTKKEKIESLLKKLNSGKKRIQFDAYKYCGVISLKESPNDIQKRLRSEWI